MRPWTKTNIVNPSIIEEVPECDKDEPWEVYRNRYLFEKTPNEYQIQDIKRYTEEIFNYFEVGSSVLIFGAGNSFFCNAFSRLGFNVISSDIVKEAATGLDPEISFINMDILSDTFDDTYDYVFSSHVLEHFSRNNLLNVVVPKLKAVSKRALVSVVPFENNWQAERAHRCRFYINDEFVNLSTKYKIIYGGVELVTWIDKQE